MSFEKWFAQSIKKFERILLKVAFFSLVLLFIAQMLMSSANFRRVFNIVERLEGYKIEIDRQVMNKPTIPDVRSDWYMLQQIRASSYHKF